MKKIDMDDATILVMEFVMASIGLAIVGPFSLAFIFFVYPYIEEAAERKGKEREMMFAAFVAFLVLWAAWLILLIVVVFEPAGE